MPPRSTLVSEYREPHGEIATRLWFLVPIRLYVGAHFILKSFAHVGAGALSDPSILGHSLAQTIYGAEYSHPIYRAIFRGTIEPNIGVFVFLVVFGELLVGLSLFCGAVTRLAAAFGLLIAVNAYWASNAPLTAPHETTAFIVMLLVLFAAGAGRAYGVDYYLRGKAPGWLM